MPGLAPVAPFDAASVSRLFFDTLALSAWKEYGGERWALRVNPSSGNLHPTEGYLVCGALPGLSDAPIVAHYAPAEHSLEVRARLTPHIWQALREGVVSNRGDGLPEETIFVGLTSILWREAWKYGDRAFRYCQHDVGHALGALSIAAAGLGWQARLLDDLGDRSSRDVARRDRPARGRAGAPRLPGGGLSAEHAVPAVEAGRRHPRLFSPHRVAGPAERPQPEPRRVAVGRGGGGDREETGGGKGQETGDGRRQGQRRTGGRQATAACRATSRFLAPDHPPAAERAGDGRADGDRAGCVLPDAAAHDAAARGCAVRHVALAAARPSGASSSTA